MSADIVRGPQTLENWLFSRFRRLTIVWLYLDSYTVRCYLNAITWNNRSLIRWSFRMKHCAQVSHWYGFSPVWILVCRKSSAGRTKRLSQITHWCFAFGLTAFIRTGGIKWSEVGVSGMKKPPSSSLCWITSVMSFSLSDSTPLSLFGDSGWIWTTSLPFESRIVGNSLRRVR